MIPKKRQTRKQAVKIMGMWDGNGRKWSGGIELSSRD